jgi:hypothetical protein
MSSSSTSYIVAPNSTVNTTPYIPEQTQLNGTGPLVDLIPQVIVCTDNPSFSALSMVAGTTDILYTDTTLRTAGTYAVVANYLFRTSGAGWSNSETFQLDICTTGTTNVTVIPNLTLQPNYFNDFNSATDELELAIVGLIILTGPAYLNARASRAGVLSANKSGAIQSFTAQKIA